MSSGRRFLFFVSSSNQCRITAPVARRLQELGCEVAFFDRFPGGHEDPRVPLAGFGFPCHELAQAAAMLSPGDVLVTGNAKGPAAYQEIVERALASGCPYVGVVDGCRAERRYGGVPLVLGWGPSSVARYRQRVEVVGSPAIEACWSEAPAFAQPPYAVVNYKFTSARNRGEYAAPEARLRWLRAVVAACAAAGLAVRVSGHPANLPDGVQPEFSTAPFAALVRGASLLVSPVSTVLFRAIAAGVPLVLVPAGDESLGEFEDPLGAFEIVRAFDALDGAVARAIADPAAFRARSRRFFETHVSIDAGRPALERMVAALLALP
ncbi:hypothetical protein HK414_08755 [Ramlibacter terrae]|uniref:Glycosyltransferase family 1 protein n=1 Tax=Ramlibacter terrae TaxID=2732511 RepID=A0ABX6P1M8_9BURK|nr:hypothetical protein HK414_08755 [Ramlibacter terrae]